MTPKLALVVLLAKMAWENGEIHSAETRLIDDLCGRWGQTMDQVRREMAESRVADLVPNLSAPRDRVVALHFVWLMANIEGTFDDWEQALYDLVNSMLGITDEERQVAEHAGRCILDGTPVSTQWARLVESSALS